MALMVWPERGFVEEGFDSAAMATGRASFVADEKC
jgi:hypothetical protein